MKNRMAGSTGKIVQGVSHRRRDTGVRNIAPKPYREEHYTPVNNTLLNAQTFLAFCPPSENRSP
jgi:hypothetical protein